MKAQLKVAEEAAGKAAQLRAEAEFRGNPRGNVALFNGKDHWKISAIAANR